MQKYNKYSNSPSVVLAILDGWGLAEKNKGNAVWQARPACWEEIWGQGKEPIKDGNRIIRRKLKASGLAVGLPDQQMGNSEVGHLTIGAGRIILQDLPRIDKSLSTNGFDENQRWQKFTAESLKGTKKVHCIAMISDGGVHAHYKHFAEVAKRMLKLGLTPVLHAITDGRDTKPTQGSEFLRKLEQMLGKNKVTLASISGRYHAFDRDQNWQRIEKAYKAIAEGQSPNRIEASFDGFANYLEERYKNDESDEFITPACAENYEGIKDGDALMFFSFRADRARQLTKALIEKDFKDFKARRVNFSSQALFAKYYEGCDKISYVLFPRPVINNSLGQVLSEQGLKQFRIAETEKYAHVTYFFSGGKEQLFAQEKRSLVPSAKVATYDLKPEMSAAEIGTKLCEAIKKHEADFYLVNFANGDMVGHCGKIEPAKQAVKSVDKEIAKLKEICQKENAYLIVTADHGNCDEMIDEKGKPMTAHSLNEVPFIIISPTDNDLTFLKNLKAGLSSIAPTVLKLLNVKIPKEMDSKPLI